MDMNSNPLVSIVIPTYGGSNYLPRAINGIQKQTYKNWELIVVDDNGVGTINQEKTKQVLRPFVSDTRIKYICHQVNQNASAARNTGAANSNGVFIAFLDDDDEYCSEFLERQVKVLSNLSDNYALVYCSHVTFFNGIQIEEIRASQRGMLLYENLSHSIEIATSSILVRKSAFDSIKGFDESFRRHQAWEFIARIAAKYLIQANDFIGYRRYLEWRTVPNTFQKAKSYREHYLTKMKPYIEMLPSKRQKYVLWGNRLDVAMWLLKEKKFGAFIKEYYNIHSGWFGMCFLLGRVKIIIRRRKMKLV